MDNILKKIDKIAIIFIAYTLLFWIFFATLKYTAPFVIGLLVAIFIKNPTEKLICEYKWNKKLAVLLTMNIFYILFIIIIGISAVLIVFEIKGLGQSMHLEVQNFLYWIKSTVDYLINTYSGLNIDIINAMRDNTIGIPIGSSDFIVGMTSSFFKNVFGTLSSLPYIITVIVFAVISTFFITMELISGKLSMNNIPKINKYITLIEEIKIMVSRYIVTYLKLIGITLIETLIVFLVFNIKYALLLSILCAILDILPIVGSALVFIPIVVFNIVNGNLITGIGIGLCYLIIIAIRQVLEPKLLASNLNIHPLASIISVFVGLQIGGMLGIIYMIFMIILYEALKKIKIL